MNGVEATCAIRRELPDVQVIGLSVQANDQTAEVMKQAGDVSYLIKDGPYDQLLRTIRSCARKSPAALE